MAVAIGMVAKVRACPVVFSTLISQRFFRIFFTDVEAAKRINHLRIRRELSRELVVRESLLRVHDAAAEG
jgi:hypothetical protein